MKHLIDTITETVLKDLAKRYLQLIKQKDPSSSATLMSVQEDLARAVGHKNMHAAQAYWAAKAIPSVDNIPAATPAQSIDVGPKPLIPFDPHPFTAEQKQWIDDAVAAYVEEMLDLIGTVSGGDIERTIKHRTHQLMAASTANPEPNLAHRLQFQSRYVESNHFIRMVQHAVEHVVAQERLVSVRRGEWERTNWNAQNTFLDTYIQQFHPTLMLKDAQINNVLTTLEPDMANIVKNICSDGRGIEGVCCAIDTLTDVALESWPVSLDDLVRPVNQIIQTAVAQIYQQHGFSVQVLNGHAHDTHLSFSTVVKELEKSSPHGAVFKHPTVVFLNEQIISSAGMVEMIHLCGQAPHPVKIVLFSEKASSNHSQKKLYRLWTALTQEGAVHCVDLEQNPDFKKHIEEHIERQKQDEKARRQASLEQYRTKKAQEHSNPPPLPQASNGSKTV